MVKWEEMVFKKLKSNFGIWKTSVNILLSIWHFLWIIKTFHCLKNVRIRNFSGPYFPAFGLNLHAVSMFLIWQFYDNKISIHRAISVIYCRKRIYLFFFFLLFLECHRNDMDYSILFELSKRTVSLIFLY